ncbi:MAG TPA: hemolysin family protein [Coriobacteriia bacterium]
MVLVVLVLTVLFGVMAAVLAAAETAVMLLPPGRVHRLVEAERRGSPQLEVIAARPYRVRAVSAMLAGLAFATVAVLGVALGSQLNSGIDLAWELVAALLGVILMFALSQAMPRALAVANPEDIALEAAPIANLVVPALYPVARLLASPFAWVISMAGGERPVSPWATAGEYRAVDTAEETEREEAEEALLEAVSDFAEKVVREVMVPRTDMRSLPDTAHVSDAVALIDKTGYSRLPVYHETTDDIRGVLYAKDLLVALAAGKAEDPVLAMARAPYFVPESKPVEELLAEMRTKTHLAIVADEYGGTAGLVTLEDLIEEIVGEISDEYDREESLLVDMGEGRFCVDARLPVDDLNELLGTEIDIDADSVGGLFTELAGRIPSLGESVEIEGLRLTVTDLQGTRIRQLTVEPAAASDEGVTHA